MFKLNRNIAVDVRFAVSDDFSRIVIYGFSRSFTKADFTAYEDKDGLREDIIGKIESAVAPITVFNKIPKEATKSSELRRSETTGNAFVTITVAPLLKDDAGNATPDTNLIGELADEMKQKFIRFNVKFGSAKTTTRLQNHDKIKSKQIGKSEFVDNNTKAKTDFIPQKDNSKESYFKEKLKKFTDSTFFDILSLIGLIFRKLLFMLSALAFVSLLPIFLIKLITWTWQKDDGTLFLVFILSVIVISLVTAFEEREKKKEWKENWRRRNYY